VNIIVCVKQVPDISEIAVDENGRLIRQGVPSILNPLDRHALEAALQIKEQQGGTVTVISMGPLQAKLALRECLAMGADSAVLISDKVFSGSDTLATSRTLAAAIRTLDRFDLILCGCQSSDSDTGQVGPQIAEYLGIAQATYAAHLIAARHQIQVQRELDDHYEELQVDLPVLITVVRGNEPRNPSVKNTIKARKAAIRIMSLSDLGLLVQDVGDKGSATRVTRVFVPPRQKQGLMIQESTAQQAAKTLVERLMPQILSRSNWDG